MSWIEKIRSKPHHQKVRLIWICSLAAAGILILLWGFTSRIGSRSERDLTLFQTLGRGFKDFKENFHK